MTTCTAEPVVARPQRERWTDSSWETRSPHAAALHSKHSASIDQVLDDSFPASDPPSWTSAITRVAVSSVSHRINEAVIRRIRAEFLEMPGLCLTIEQAERLWDLEPRTCEALLKSLIDSRFLCRTRRGLFVMCRPRG